MSWRLSYTVLVRLPLKVVYASNGLACEEQAEDLPEDQFFNDQGYGVLRGIEARQFDGRNFGVDLTTPDFPALAKSMGVHAARVAGPAEFESRFREAIASGRPALIDIDMLALSPLSLPGTRPAPRR